MRQENSVDTAGAVIQTRNFWRKILNYLKLEPKLNTETQFEHHHSQSQQQGTIERFLAAKQQLYNQEF